MGNKLLSFFKKRRNRNLTEIEFSDAESESASESEEEEEESEEGSFYIYHLFNEDNEQEEEDVCSICLDIFNDTDIHLTPCKHKFHKNCLNEWLKQRSSCPNCRKLLPSTKINPPPLISLSIYRQRQQDMIMEITTTRTSFTISTVQPLNARSSLLLSTSLSYSRF